MNEQLITFETAKIAKEKGFSTGTYYLWETYECNKKLETPKLCKHEAENYNSEGDGISFEAPTQSLLQKWLREEHNIHLVCWWYDKEDKFYTEIGRKTEHNLFVQTGDVTKMFNTYEEALETGLLEALKLI